MKLLDLYSKAGGAGMGYHRAGFDVIGVDIEPQPRYPFEFIQADAIEMLADIAFVSQFDAIHASPPCKVHTSLKAFSAAHHVDLIPDTRRLLEASGLPYVIENVVGAPMVSPVTLCGSMFDLGVRRHRLFETNWALPQPACRHAEQAAASPMYAVKRYHSGRPVVTPSPVIGVYGGGKGLGPGEVDMWRAAMGIAWMTRDELAQAIPPAYTRHVGHALMAHLTSGDAS